MTTARRKTDIRKSELVAAALDIISTHGIRALTTRSLAERVGLSTGAIFKHFVSLDALLVGVVEHVAQVLASTFPDPGIEPLARLEQFVMRRCQAVGTEIGILRLMLSEQFMLALPDGAAATLGGCVAETRRFITQCVEDGQASGAIRSDLSAPATSAIVMGTIQVLALTRAAPGGRSFEPKDVRLTLFAMLRPQGVPAVASPGNPGRRKSR